MLKSIKNDLLHLLGILNLKGKILLYVKDCKTSEEFFFTNNQLIFNASIYLLINIGEYANKLSDELKSKYNTVEWRKIVDFRNLLVHKYHGVDSIQTFDIIKNKLPELENEIWRIIVNELKLGTFDIQEVSIAKDSSFYEHIDFSKLVPLII